MCLSNGEAKKPIVIEYFWPNTKKFRTVDTVPIDDGDKISHYRRNIAVMAPKKGGIKSLSTVEEPGTAVKSDS